MKTLLKNGKLISDNRIQEADLLIENERIAKIATDISAKEAHRVIDLEGMLVLPGVIDDQVHFREPGLTHKATIATESAAALTNPIQFLRQLLLLLWRTSLPSQLVLLWPTSPFSWGVRMII